MAYEDLIGNGVEPAVVPTGTMTSALDAGLRQQAQYISYGPARKSSLAEPLIYSDGKTEMAPHLPTAPENMKNALESDWEFWVDRDAELNERFNAWLAAG